MILRDQAKIVMDNLNGIALDLLVASSDEKYDIQFYVTDNTQDFNRVTKLDDKEYIPAIMTRFDPFIPLSSNGVNIDYTEISFHIKFNHREAVEEITNKYIDMYHAKPQYTGIPSTLYTQYLGKYIFQNQERSQDGLNLKYATSTLRIQWHTILSGVHYDETSLKINNVIYPVKIQTYRNDKATVSNKGFNADGNINANLVSESLIITVPLNSVTAISPLWTDIHTRSYNKTYTIIDNYSVGGIITKDWELKSGIVNKEENKIISFTAIFDIPLPRATLTITHKPLVGEQLVGTVIVTEWNESGTNSLDARMIDREVKGKEVRQVNSYSLSYLYEVGNMMSKILAERSHKKVDGDRFDITYIFEDLTIQMNDLVIEKGTHNFNDNPGVVFTVTFAEGV